MRKPIVVIAEDSKIGRGILSAALSEHYTLLEAKSGVEAIELISQHGQDIELVLLDLIMPEGTGFDVLEHLRSHALLTEFPVVVVTGSSDLEDELRAYASGAIDVIRKPFSADVLLSKVDRFVSLYGSRRGFAEELKRTALQLEGSQKLDPVTGLLNMQQFLTLADEFLRGLDEESCRDYQFAYGNIRNFKYFNVNYGKDRGDELLRRIARMQQADPSNVLCARFGQDHLVVLSNNKDLEAATLKLEEEFAHEYSQYGMALKAGVYRVRSPHGHAYKACEFAKLACDSIHNSQLSYCEFSEALEQRLVVSEYVLRNVDSAIEQQRIQIYFQPLVRSITGSVCGFEALSRWTDPTYGFLAPSDFIPALEDAGMVHKLDQHVIRAVCDLLAARLREGKQVAPVSLNLSRMDFFKFDIVDYIESTVREFGLPRDLIVAEITESIAMSDQQHIGECIDRLRGLGYRVWMDDFGSEYSSLAVLQDFNFDEIKLDRAFLSQFNAKSKKVIRSIVAMAKTMGIPTLAEGVETQEQLDFLRSIGCDKVQGYLISRPMPADELEATFAVSRRKTENRIQQWYYDHLSTIDFMTENPMAICEYNGDDCRILFTNPQFDKAWDAFGLGDIQTLLAQGDVKETDFWDAFKARLNTLRLDNVFYTMDYAYEDYTIRIRTRCVARYEGRLLCQLEIGTRGRISTDIRDIVDVAKIEEAMTAWSTACNMATICLDANGEYVTGQIGFTDFCNKYTRRSEEGAARCLYCDMHNEGVYYCHAGLMDFGFDIVLDSGQVVGRIIGGQVLPEPIDEEKIGNLADELEIPRESYLEAARKVPLRDEASIKASAYLLDKIINDIVNSEYAKSLQEKYISELDALSKRDSLTGLYNSRYCMNYVDTLVFEKKRFTLYLFDLDGFKEVNDTYGHLFGDEVLVKFAQSVARTVPENVVMGRFGGDEFVLIAQTGDRAEVEGLASLIQDCARSLTFDAAPGFELTVSIGVSIYPDHGCDARSLYGVADSAMYAIKNAGRDGYLVHGEEAPLQTASSV